MYSYGAQAFRGFFILKSFFFYVCLLFPLSFWKLHRCILWDGGVENRILFTGYFVNLCLGCLMCFYPFILFYFFYSVYLFFGEKVFFVSYWLYFRIFWRIALLTGAVKYYDCTSAAGVRPTPPTSVLNMTLNCIWWWRSIPRALENVYIIIILSFVDWLVGWLGGWVLWQSNLCGLFNAKSIFMQIVLFKTINFSMSTQFNCQKYFYFKLFSLFKQF